MYSSRVLVVDDENAIRSILSEVLSEEGYEVTEASSGDMALTILGRDWRFCAVVTDVHMPGQHDGLAVGRHVRENFPQLPVVYMTGRPDVVHGAITLGEMDALVCKPYLPSQVLRALRSLIRPFPLPMPAQAG